MELRDTDFEDMVLKSDRPVLVDFWASWCPPCKMMQPVVDKLAVKVGDWADVYSINIDRSPALAQQYQVSGVPTFIAYAGGEVIDRRTGALTEGQLMSLLKKAEEAMPEDDASVPVSGEALAAGLDAVDDEGYPPASALRLTNWITIVSGLPRSGTSMMMRMLEAGGIPALTDELRTPDEDNPNGYYEFEDVKSIEDYSKWIDRAPGHSVKMVYSLLKNLPTDREYRVLFMRRNVDEILQSQKKMLERKGITTDIPDAMMKALFERELRQFYSWIPSQTHLQLVNISYNDLLSNPEGTIDQINRHFGETLDTEAMVRLVDPGLYRNRAA
ncbi:MAG: sulfotransferase [Planctomycetaceae bacterium]|nr:sulfotransferase [Planctomycetaceae bacterium]